MVLEYDSNKRLGRIIRNHYLPYFVKLLGEKTIVYAEHQGSPISLNRLVTVEVGNITHERNGNKYASGRVVKGYRSVELTRG